MPNWRAVSALCVEWPVIRPRTGAVLERVLDEEVRLGSERLLELLHGSGRLGFGLFQPRPLLTQLDEAGIKVAGAEDTISEDAKLELLTHLRRSHGQEEPTSGDAAPRRLCRDRR